MLKTPLEQVANLVEKARHFDAETAPVDSDPRSNPGDDNDRAVLEDPRGNPTRQQVVGALDALDDGQGIEHLALMRPGRGDFDCAGWRDALTQARKIRNAAETQHLIGTPLLADYLAEAIAALGYSLGDFEKGRP